MRTKISFVKKGEFTVMPVRALEGSRGSGCIYAEAKEAGVLISIENTCDAVLFLTVSDFLRAGIVVSKEEGLLLEGEAPILEENSKLKKKVRLVKKKISEEKVRKKVRAVKRKLVEVEADKEKQEDHPVTVNKVLKKNSKVDTRGRIRRMPVSMKASSLNGREDK